MDNLNAGMVARLRLPLPPLDEQRRIVQLIEAEEHKGCSGVSTVERETALIREYRTRLVADVVTGQLDAREAAARLPEELEPIDDAETSVESEEALNESDLEAEIAEERV
jgi:type I restriction enzyme S subunit